MRYFVRFSYLGKSYHGWQKQPNAHTVQGQMEDCFSTLLRTPLELVAAGRTDTGVHASEMFAHFDAEILPELTELQNRLNSFLPDDISISAIFPVDPETHARFSAIERCYEYQIVQTKNPFLLDTAYYFGRKLDLEKMNEAASLLIGQKDFECFSKTNTDVKTFICDVREARWNREGDRLVFRISADRFLRNMVRAITGTLLDVGIEKLRPEDVNTIIKSKDRSRAGASVPAKGLSLVRVQYPENTIAKNG